jgi:DNA-binding transcriptional LysR family regulator
MPTHKLLNSQLELTSDLQKWRAFLAIADLGSLTRASLFLNINPSLLSRHLNALERDCGARLFNRTGRGVSLSETGHRLFPLACELLQQAQTLESAIRDASRELVGRVTIGSLPSITNPIAGKLYAHMRAHHPGIRVKILEGSSGQVEEWLADGRVDAAIFYRYGGTLPEHEQSLCTVESYLVGAAGDRLTATAEVPFAALDGLPFILPSAPNGLRTTLDALARKHRIQLEPLIEADSLPLMRSVVASERVYTVLPLHAVWTDVEEHKLQAARIISPDLRRIVALSYANTKGVNRAVDAVTAMIVQSIHEEAARGMWSIS